VRKQKHRSGDALLIIAQTERDKVIRRFDADHVPRIGEMVFLFDPDSGQPMFWRVRDVQWQLRKDTGLTLAVLIIEASD
jgi:hypothetical protein